VIYAGESEGSMTPPGWYGWLHHTADVPPTEENYAARAWELPHQPNLTGTPQASAGLDLGRQCAASGDRQLRGLDAGRLK
jgi:NADH:ubiquinone oxidoreductase subunit